MTETCNDFALQSSKPEALRQPKTGNIYAFVLFSPIFPLKEVVLKRNYSKPFSNEFSSNFDASHWGCEVWKYNFLSQTERKMMFKKLNQEIVYYIIIWSNVYSTKLSLPVYCHFPTILRCQVLFTIMRTFNYTDCIIIDKLENLFTQHEMPCIFSRYTLYFILVY